VIFLKVKMNVEKHYVMKACKGNGGEAPYSLYWIDFSSHLHASASLISGKELSLFFG
jgi:hypothetical protein